MDRARQQMLTELEQSLPHTRTCPVSGKSFFISQEEINFHATMEIPLPTLAPEVRLEDLFAFRNEISLYKRTCDGTGKEIISMHSPNSPWTVYSNEYWWSDHWSAESYGRDYDPDRSFLEQLEELHRVVPQISLFSKNTENAEYTNYSSDIRNCYMSFVIYYNSENTHYSHWAYRTKDSISCAAVEDCEGCFYVRHAQHCNTCFYLEDATNCYDCYLSADLTGCKHCILSTGLRNKEYYVRNQQVSAEEFARVKKELFHETTLEEYRALMEHRILRGMHQVNCSDCIGTYLSNSTKSTYVSGSGLENCSVGIGEYGKNCRTFIGGTFENCYYVSMCGWGQNISFSFHVLDSSFVSYSYSCIGSRDLFGCVGLRNKQYCILNKQYTKDEYEQLQGRIICDMLDRGEYGRYLPHSMNPFFYNESTATVPFPKTEAEAHAAGWRWRSQDKRVFAGPWYTPEEDVQRYLILDNKDALLTGIIQCKRTGMPFKIMPQELAFHLKHNIPLPQTSPKVRLEEISAYNLRFSQRVLVCMNTKRHDTKQPCTTKVHTFSSVSSPQRIFCDECYEHTLL